IRKHYDETSDVGQKVIRWLKDFKNDKNSKQIDHFWDLQVKRQNISVEIKLLEEKSKLLEKQQNELENEIDLEQVNLYLDTVRETRNQGGLLQKEVTKKIENRVTGHKRAREEKPSNPPKKIKLSGKKVEYIRKCDGKKRLSAVEKAVLRYGLSQIIDLSAHMKQRFSLEDRKFMMKDYMSLLQVPCLNDEETSFVTTIENMVLEKRINEAYEFCARKFTSSEANSYMRKISKVYLDLSEDGDMLDSANTEIDIILKACSYIVEGLRKSLVVKQRWGESFCPLSKNTDYKNGRKCDVRFLSQSGIDLGEWEFASNATPQKAIGDCCQSAHINQSILNGTNGQMLIEDLIEGFYVVFPGSKFELPMKLQHIGKLKSSVNIIKFVMDMYEKIGEIVETKESRNNAFDDIFDSDELDTSPILSRNIFVNRGGPEKQ
ncbi:1519_t:CDS:10, partial [Paraglomus occultum]